jgi:PAS domain S-box-containing protein
MNLRNRMLLILGLVSITLLVIIAVVSLTITIHGLDLLEYTDMNKAMGQVRSSLGGESRSLLSTTRDWGWWDETATFVATNNSDYIRNNLNPDSLETINVPFILVLDPAGRPVYGRLLSPDFLRDEILSEEMVRVIRDTPSLVNHTPGDPGTSGILVMPPGPMLVASTPILTSDRSGPAQGTIIMGRYIENGPLERITAATGYSIALFREENPASGTTRFGELEPKLVGEPVLLEVNNDSMVTGYGSVEDLAGRNLIISVAMPRDIYHAGVANIVTYLFFLSLWAVIAALIVVYIMDRMVLRRIDILTDRVRSFAGNPAEIPPPVLEGSDELAVLEHTILASRADLQISESRLSVFINALPDPAALYSREGKILLANTALAAYFNTRPDELIGKGIQDYLQGEDMDKHLREVREAVAKKTTVQYEAEAGGRTLLISHYPVLDSRGDVIQIGLLTFDISERKRLENALRKVTNKIALLNTVIFKDIQSRVFVQRGYHKFLKKELTDPRQREYLEKQEAAVKGIESSLEFAKQYYDLGINPPRWQQVSQVMVFAISHFDPGTLRREFRLDGLEIYADSLLERVFFNLVKNSVRHAKGATFIRAGYTITDEWAVIFIEDDGPGIPAEEKERIFERGTEVGGAVGLFLSREILSITGITIRETGVPGKGARFELLVPKGAYRTHPA